MGLLLLVLLFAQAFCSSKILVKRLSGPPSEFGSMGIPSPINAALEEDSALLALRWGQGATAHSQK